MRSQAAIAPTLSNRLKNTLQESAIQPFPTIRPDIRVRQSAMDETMSDLIIAEMKSETQRCKATDATTICPMRPTIAIAKRQSKKTLRPWGAAQT